MSRLELFQQVLLTANVKFLDLAQAAFSGNAGTDVPTKNTTPACSWLLQKIVNKGIVVPQKLRPMIGQKKQFSTESVWVRNLADLKN